MPFDDQFSRLLHEAAELAPDPPGAVLAGSARRIGRRQAVRRRAAMAGSVAALALVGLAAAELAPGIGGSSRVSAAGARSGRITGAFMDDTLKSLLPPGQVTDDQGFGIGEMALPGIGPTATLKYDDGHGAGMVVLSTNRVPVPIVQGTEGTRCQDPFEAPVEGCVRTVRPDGSVLVIDRLGPRAPNVTRNWIAIYTGTDGRQVRVDEYNATTAGPPLTRENPPLSADQLTAVVTSTAWNPVFEAFDPVPTGAPTAPAGSAAASPEPSAILATVGHLLPPGVLSEAGSTPQDTAGQAHLRVTVEGRASLLQVTVFPQWQQGVDEHPRQTFESGAAPGTLLRTVDGSSVITTAVGASKGGGGPDLQWSVDVLHPDGTRVRVTEWNGANGYDFEPGTPALTTDQLADVATASAWRH
ncbi:hypothetical protein GCM10009665_24550 [Kitasatospora nipponensis]|uniref:DUF4367 domain-containing protein n=1 Tax=Kitasatospora nipponensis TaxID=258049 RepID=A0ABP4GV62_9ACTN